MNTATLIEKNLEGFTGRARLYRVEPSVEYEHGDTNYVVVSATEAPYTGPETYIFPADKDGKVIDWGELLGSYRGGFDFDKALTDGGWTVE